MRKAETIYWEIQENGKRNIELTAANILKYVELCLGNIGLPSGISSINKLYILIENGFYPMIQKILDSYDYDYSVELQYLLMNIAYRGYNSPLHILRESMGKFPSIEQIYQDDCGYCLSTKLGTICFEPLTQYKKDRNIRRFVLQYETYGYCHASALEFIKANPTYRAVTSLIPNQFGEKQYHSYIETPTGYADLSNNIHLSKTDFETVMQPQVLNVVDGFQIEEQEKHLTEEDLPDSKTLLLRLAVHKQVNFKSKL